TIQKHQKAIDLLRSHWCLASVLVRGVRVDYTSKSIHMTYFNDDDTDATDYLEKLTNPKDHFAWGISAGEAITALLTNMDKDAEGEKAEMDQEALEFNDDVDLTKISYITTPTIVPSSMAYSDEV
ncbi:hypothetical protein HAX54_023691, partial [Datura stramonium]|nr:hypothetical protein [Datura stramonium]